MCQVCDINKHKAEPEHYLDKLPLTSENGISKRQVRKAITSNIALKLIELDSPIKSEYIRSLNCGSYVSLKSDGTTSSWYCGKRWCTVCNNIKQAELIEAYLSSLEAMAEPFLVTLTVPSVCANELSSTIKGMGKTFAKIKDRLKKQGYTLNGIRKIESNFNHKADTFNPHYHIVLDGADECVYLVRNWLKAYPDASDKAQNITRADKNSLKELFKYQAKVIINSTFNAEATDVIMRALKGVRTFQNFGNVKKASVTFDSDLGKVVSLSDTDKVVEPDNEPHTIAFYVWQNDNWYSYKGEPLVDSSLPDKVLSLIDNIREDP